jgi:hypothetical protein
MQMSGKIEDVTSRVVASQTILLRDHETKIILCMMDNNDVYIPLRPVLDYLGLQWSGQTKRLLRHQDQLKPVYIRTKAGDGKFRKMLCIKRYELPRFLLSVESNHIPEGTMDRVWDLLTVDAHLIMKADKSRGLSYEPVSRGRKKGDPDVWDTGLAQLGFVLVHGRSAQDIHEVLEQTQARCADDDHERWYAGKDICKVLYLSQYRTVMKRVSDNNKRMMPIKTPGGTQRMICINVAGITEITRSCHKPVAKRALKKYLG